MLRKLRSNQGFTLIELLIVVAIIGILAAIAIPQFAKYRIQGYNSSAASDLKNARTSEESLFAEWQGYGFSQMEAVAAPQTFTLGGTGVGAPATSSTAAVIPSLQLLDRDSISRGMQIAVGNNVTLYANTDAAVAPAVVVTSFRLGSKHIQGDTTYAADSDSTTNYKDAVTNATGVVCPVPPASVPNVIEPALLAAPWVAM